MPLPEVPRAVVDRFSFTSESSRSTVELAIYIDAHHAEQSLRRTVKRVIIVAHGHDRDAWNAWSHMSAAREKAVQKSHGRLRAEEVMIVAPIFFNGLDKDSFGWQGKGSTGRLLVWKGNGWGEGLACQYPADSPTVSTFEALDALTQHFSNDRWFPSVSELVLAGHSMGGQLIHRYAVLGAATPSRPKDRPSVGISFVVANPSSFLYLTEERPCATKGSEGYNHYKYGLQGIREALAYRPALHANASSLLERYTARTMHHLQGLRDKGVGDDRPQALAQGANRLERGQHWMAWLEKVGWPSHTTVDYVPGVGHDSLAMFASDDGIQRCFFDTQDQFKESSATNGRDNSRTRQ